MQREKYSSVAPFSLTKALTIRNTRARVRVQSSGARLTSIPSPPQHSLLRDVISIGLAKGEKVLGNAVLEGARVPLGVQLRQKYSSIVSSISVVTTGCTYSATIEWIQHYNHQ